MITGATGKLGRIIANHLVGLGVSVVVTARSQSRAESLAVDLALDRNEHYDVQGIALNLSDQASVARLPEELVKRGLPISHLVSNARDLNALAVEQDGATSPEKFMAEMEIDVVQPYRLIMAMAKHSEHRLRTVVNVGSQYGVVAPNPNLYGGDLSQSPVQYGVAKAALHHLTRELAVRLAPDVRVNCVAFGGFAGRVDDEFLKRYGALVPSGRMLTDDQAAGPVRFLLGEDSSAINGHVLMADGGWTIW